MSGPHVVEQNVKPRAAKGRSADLWPVNSSHRARRWKPPQGLDIGHEHLRSLLVVYDTLTRRGVRGAFKVLTVPQVAEAVVACRYFGLHGLANLLLEIPQAVMSSRSTKLFDSELHRRYPTANRLVEAIRSRIEAAPADLQDGPL